MVAVQQRHLDAAVAQHSQAADEVLTGLVRPPVPVIDVAGDDEQVGLLIDAKLHQVVVGPPCRRSQFGGQSAVTEATEPLQRAIEVDVGGMNDSRHQFAAPCVHARSGSWHPGRSAASPSVNATRLGRVAVMLIVSF